MNYRFPSARMGLILTLLLGGCASLQPARSPTLASEVALRPLPDDPLTRVWRDPEAIAGDAYFIAPVQWRLETPSVSDAEQRELETHLQRAIERALQPARIVKSASADARRVDATITGLDPSSPALNAVMSMLLGPLDTGGARVEIVVAQGEPPRPVAVISAAQNGSVLSTQGFRRWGHARQALDHAADQLALLLASPGRP